MGHNSIVRNSVLGVLLSTALLVLSSIAIAEDETSDAAIRVTLLGTGIPAPNPRQFGPSTLVEAGGQKLLFDCGRGCLDRLWNLGPEFARETKHIFLTHLHSDHTVGMADLYMNGWVMKRIAALEIFGPGKTADLMQNLRLAFDEDVKYRVDLQSSMLTRDALEYSVTEVEEGRSFQFGDVTVTAFTVDHHVIEPAFGYRVDFGGRSVVISGDTTYSKNLIENSRGADVIIHEVISPAMENFVRTHYPKYMADDVVALHTRPADAGRVFAESGTRMGVYTHLDNDPAQLPELIAQTRQTWSGSLEVGVDLMVIEIGEEIRVTEPQQEQ